MFRKSYILVTIPDIQIELLVLCWCRVKLDIVPPYRDISFNVFFFSFNSFVVIIDLESLVISSSGQTFEKSQAKSIIA